MFDKIKNYSILFSLLVLFVACEKDSTDLNEKDENKPSEKDCGITIGEDYIVMEAEATNSPLDLWEIVTVGDKRYKDKGNIMPVNSTHLEFTGNKESSGPPTSPLEYTFIAPKTGVYKLAMRMYQRLEGAESDKCNDVYVKLKGDFTSATDKYTTEDLKANLKFYGRGIDKWGCANSGDGGSKHAKSALLYNLTKDKEYTLTMSGRSQRTNIDYIIIFEQSLNIKAKSNVDLAESNEDIFMPNWSCRNNES